MKEKITSITAFIGAIGWLLAVSFAFLDGEFDDLEEYSLFVAIFLPSISGVLYIIWTKFGNRKVTELDSLNYENVLLQKKIEQLELKKVLKEQESLSSE